MAEHIDKEIEAIRAVLHALEPLRGDVRANVLQRLQIVLEPNAQGQPVSPSTLPEATKVTVEATLEVSIMPSHIKQFKEPRKPRSANEMAALVAFYLANVAATPERKDKITTKDIETYFKIAEFRRDGAGRPMYFPRSFVEGFDPLKVRRQVSTHPR